MKIRNRRILVKNENGATAVYVAVIIILMLMFTALAIDVNHLYGVRNELQNGADGASLAGASVLFDSDGNLAVQDALDEAERIANANRTGNQNIVEVAVETGHWSFTDNEFTANSNTTQTDWQERPFDELDVDIDFINAVKVTTTRSDTPSFFAGFFGYDQFFVGTEAVAYIGFAGTVFPADIDQPIAICRESIINPDTGGFTCNMGRMLNSGSNTATHNTGGWTNFTQPCETANASDMRPLICTTGNQHKVTFGEGIGTTGGVQDTTFNDLYDCWDGYTNKQKPWPLALPVVLCPGNNVSNCAELDGAVFVDVIWMIHQNDPHYEDVPVAMREVDGFPDFPMPESAETLGFERWKAFVDHFGLQNVDGPPGSPEDYEEMYQKKNIFFLSKCEEHSPPIGESNGQNYGILAKIPKLVQ